MDYVLIGGVAVHAHGHVRTTVDLDVIAAWTAENMRRVAATMRDLGTPPGRVRGRADPGRAWLLRAAFSPRVPGRGSRRETAGRRFDGSDPDAERPSQFRHRPGPKRRQDLDDIAVLEQLRADQPTRLSGSWRNQDRPSSPRSTSDSRSEPGRSQRTELGSRNAGRQERG